MIEILGGPRNRHWLVGDLRAKYADYVLIKRGQTASIINPRYRVSFSYLNKSSNVDIQGATYIAKGRWIWILITSMFIIYLMRFSYPVGCDPFTERRS